VIVTVFTMLPVAAAEIVAATLIAVDPFAAPLQEVDTLPLPLAGEQPGAVHAPIVMPAGALSVTCTPEAATVAELLTVNVYVSAEDWPG